METQYNNLNRRATPWLQPRRSANTDDAQEASPMLPTTVPQSKKPRISRTTDSRSGRFYFITDPVTGEAAKYPSVTTILSAAIAKPALINWAAREERLATAEAAADLHAELAALKQQLPRSMYLLALEQRLGKTKAHQKALT